MSLDIGDALRTGLDRTLERNGAILFVLFLVLQSVSTVARQSAFGPLYRRLIQQLRAVSTEPLPPELTQIPDRSSPLAVAIPLEGALALILIIFVLGQAARVISARTFISDETDQLYEPSRWIGWATLSSVVGTIIIAVLVFFLILPFGIFFRISPVLALLWGVIALVIGVIIGLSFYFFRQEIAAEDSGPIDALADSWSLVNGDRFEVLGLIISLLFIDFVVGLLGSSLFGLLGPMPGVIVSLVIGAALLVFSSAVVAQAYRQLRAEKRDVESDGSDGSDTTDEDGWEPDEKWDDPPL